MFASLERRADGTIPVPLRIYGPEAIQPYDEEHKAHLAIDLNNRQFLLPFENVGKDGQDIWIAYLNPSPFYDPSLTHAAAHEMADLIHALGARFIITPSSHKSEAFIRQAVQLARAKANARVDLMILPGTKKTGAKNDKGEFIRISEDQVRTQSAPDLVMSYRPVTSLDHGQLMGMTQAQRDMLRSFHPDGEGILYVDDVLSAGGTRKTAFSLINRALELPEEYEHTSAFLAVELPWSETYYRALPPSTHTIIRIPEFVGALPVPSGNPNRFT